MHHSPSQYPQETRLRTTQLPTQRVHHQPITPISETETQSIGHRIRPGPTHYGGRWVAITAVDASQDIESENENFLLELYSFEATEWK